MHPAVQDGVGHLVDADPHERHGGLLVLPGVPLAVGDLFDLTGQEHADRLAGAARGRVVVDEGVPLAGAQVGLLGQLTDGDLVEVLPVHVPQARRDLPQLHAHGVAVLADEGHLLAGAGGGELGADREDRHGARVHHQLPGQRIPGLVRRVQAERLPGDVPHSALVDGLRLLHRAGDVQVAQGRASRGRGDLRHGAILSCRGGVRGPGQPRSRAEDSSSSRACSRAAAESPCPASMRASSSTRSSAVSVTTSEVVTPAAGSEFFSTRTCRSA